MRIGVDIDSLVERDMMRMQAVFRTEEASYSESVSADQGRGLVSSERSISERCENDSFTANNRGGFEQFCTEVVLIPSLRHLNHGNVISPQFPILVMLDIIYSYYLEQDKYEKEVLHDNTLRALEEGEGMHRSF